MEIENNVEGILERDGMNSHSKVIMDVDIVSGSSARRPDGDMNMEPCAHQIEILHFNDVYEVEARAREPVGGVARFISRLRQHPEAIILFSGDALAPSLMSTVTKGEHMVKFLNMMDIRVACIGNHEFDFGVEHLEEKCVAKTTFPWLCSNAWHVTTGHRLAGAAESIVVEHQGVKIGLMGLIEEEWLATLATIERDEVLYTDYVQVAKDLCAKLRDAGATVIVALTHMRTPNDRRLAEHVPELDLILGGHDHEVVREVVSGVPIIKSGSDFRNFTKLTLKLDARRRKQGEIGYELAEICQNDAEDPTAAQLVAEYQQELARSMDKVLGELGCSMDATFAHIRSRETNTGNWIADAIRDGIENAGTHVDAVLLNSGTLRADDVFPPGPFLMKDLVTLLPMLDELCVLQMTGAQLLEALENGVSMYPKLEGRFPCVSGIRFEFDAAMPPTNRIIPGTLQVGERPLDLSASYNVATKYYLASGKDGYTVFTKCNVISDGEGTPLLPDLIRQQFSTVHHLNAHLDLNGSSPPSPQPSPCDSPTASSSPRLPSSPSSPERGGGVSRGGSVQGLLQQQHIQALQRNIHIAAMAPSGDTTIDSLPPAAAARPPRIHQIAHLPSSADLEALLAGGEGDPKHLWPYQSPSHTHPVRIHGRFQIFARVDGRLVCRNGIKHRRESME